MSDQGKRSVQLDVLRGVAILLVLGRHLELPRPDGVLGLLAEGWFRLGWLGVDLFFVLSGYLIGGLLLAEGRQHGRIDVVRFLVRRGFKIYPAYYVFIAYLVAMPILKALAGGGDAAAVALQQWHLYWPNLLFLQNYVGANPAGHTWSLAVEEHFYLVLPLLVAWLARSGRMRALVAVCVACAAACLALRILSVATEDAFSVRMAATHLRLDALMCGVGIRAFAQYSPQRFAAMRQVRLPLVVLGALLWSVHLVVEPSTAFVRTLGLSATFIGAGAFLLAACNTGIGDFGRPGRVVAVGARAIAWVGVYSYGIYLWHVTAMGILERVIARKLATAADGSSSVEWLVGTIVVCSGAVIIGVVMSKLVEWPIIRLRDRLYPSRIAPRPHGAKSEEKRVAAMPAGTQPAANPTRGTLTP